MVLRTRDVYGEIIAIKCSALTAVLKLAHAYNNFREESVFDNNHVHSYVVYKCHNKAGAWIKDNGISFFRFPKHKRKRAAWVKAIQRDKWQPTEARYVCSTHFEGEWHSDDLEDVNFSPTIFTFNEKIPKSVEKARS